MAVQQTSSGATYAPPSPANKPAALRVTWGWWAVLVGSGLITLYALSFYVRREAAFPPELAPAFKARPWTIYTHVLFAALVLGLGPFQFRRDILVQHRALHRNMGRTYVIGAFMTGVVGLYMAQFSFGGLVTHFGFGVLAVLTGTAAAIAYRRIRAMDVRHHREWMIRSFALIFAAVTLRIELPLMMVGGLTYPTAYRIVSWLCWVPNIIWAEWYVRRSRPGVGTNVPTHSRALLQP